MVHVPYKVSAPAVNDLVAGQVPLMFAEFPAVRLHVTPAVVSHNSGIGAVGSQIRNAPYSEEG